MNAHSTYRPHSFYFFFCTVFLFFITAAVYSGFYVLAVIPFVILLFQFGFKQLHFVFLLLLFTIPWSVEYQVTPELGTDIPDEALMIITGALAIAYAYMKPGCVMYAFRHPLWIFLVFHLVWIIVASLFSSNSLISLKYVLAKSWYITAFAITPFLIFRERENIRRAAIVFIVSTILVTLIILIRHYQLNFLFDTIDDAVIPFFRNHVNYSAMLVCSIPILVAFYSLNSKRSLRVFIFFLFLVVLSALFLSYSRGAWLALIAGLCTYWMIRNKLLFFFFVISILLVMGTVYYLQVNNRYLRYAHDYNTTVFHPDFQEYLKATYELQDVSTAERFNRWIAAVRMVKDNWLTGYGPNTFYYHYKPYTVSSFKTWISRNEDHSTVHNYYLLVLVEQGIPGLLFFLLLTGAMLSYAQRIYHGTSDRFYKAVTMATGVILVMTIVVNFLSDLIESDKSGSLFFLCLGMLIVCDINTRNKKMLNFKF